LLIKHNIKPSENREWYIMDRLLYKKDDKIFYGNKNRGKLKTNKELNYSEKNGILNKKNIKMH